MEPLLTQVLHDRYQIHSLLGRKTGRRTFLALDLETNALVIVKLLLFAPDFTWEDLKLFEREAEILKSLDHATIPKYLDFFEVETNLGKGFVLVQSYIAARSLQDWLESGRRFSETDLETIARELLLIVAYLHRQQPPVIHRDIKPSNVLLGERIGNSPGTVYLVDLGSVQTVAHGGTITVVGTYGYMPPEQFGGRALPASDLYSVGATLIYLATGQHPADLPQHDLQIEFEPFASLSPSFIRWLQWLITPSVSGRPASAQAALEVDFAQHGQRAAALGMAWSANHSLALGSRDSSTIELQKSNKTLALKVLPQQLHTAAQDPLPGIVWTVFAVTLSGLVFAGLAPQVFLGLLLLGSLEFLQRTLIRPLYPQAYQVLLEREEHSITVSLLSLSFNGARKVTLVSQGRLKAVSAGGDLPQYRLNIDCYRLGNVFYMTGNHAEIQWLCDELNAWTELPIERWQPPTPYR